MRKVSDIVYLYLEVSKFNYEYIVKHLYSMGYSVNHVGISKFKSIILDNILRGSPYIFINLYGCNLYCGSFCDKDNNDLRVFIGDIIDIGQHDKSYIEEYYSNLVERYLVMENMGL